MTKRTLILSSIVFVAGLYASAVVSAPSTGGVSSQQPTFAASDEESESVFDAYNQGEAFYIWTTTESKIA